MATNYQTPGVYIQEVDRIPHSIVGEATSIPVFIGYTEHTTAEGNSLLHKLISIRSFQDFTKIFGEKPPVTKYTLHERTGSTKTLNFSFGKKLYALHQETVHYRMYASIKHFYENGGGNCFIMSIGTYEETKRVLTATKPFEKALQYLVNVQDNFPTLLVIPDLVEMEDTKAYTVQNKMLEYCGNQQNCFAILDIPKGFEQLPTPNNCIENFRNHIQPSDLNYLGYGAAYYPWLHTSIYNSSDVSIENIFSKHMKFQILRNMVSEEFTASNGIVNPEIADILNILISELHKSAVPNKQAQTYDGLLKTMSKSYQIVHKTLLNHLNLLAPSPAIAGIFCKTDASKGVWKAPANVQINTTISPAVTISNTYQEYLNVSPDGKSVNGIRQFPRRGNLVWGARTLAGNDNEWRYISIRRTLMYIETSIREGIMSYTFSANNTATWESIKLMARNFLANLWRQGAFMGASEKQAFYVQIGLNETMTTLDVNEGRLILILGVALQRPAEFNILKIDHEVARP